MSYNFIEQEFLQDISCCDKIIEWFEDNKKNHRSGTTSGSSGSGVNLETKDTTDIGLNINNFKNGVLHDPGDVFFKTLQNLWDFHGRYQEKYYSLRRSEFYHIVPNFNLQRYYKGQHFKQYHYESSSRNSRHRVLTWMIYLNDVEEGGLTDFPFQEMTVKPQKGLMLIWPADFTHLHCGEPVEGGVKYIMTGWMGLPFYLPSAGSSVQLPKGITFSRSYC